MLSCGSRYRSVDFLGEGPKHSLSERWDLKHQKGKILAQSYMIMLIILLIMVIVQSSGQGSKVWALGPNRLGVNFDPAT